MFLMKKNLDYFSILRKVYPDKSNELTEMEKKVKLYIERIYNEPFFELEDE